MKELLFLLSLLTFVLTACDREKIVDKTKLHGYDYRLFQLTPAWELAKAVEDSDCKRIKSIIKEDPSLVNIQDSIYGSTLLILAIYNHNYKSFTCLLEVGADVNIHDKFQGSSAIIVACEYPGVKMSFLDKLIEYGADIDDIQADLQDEYQTERFSALMAATAAQKWDFVERLVDLGANINYNYDGCCVLDQAWAMDDYNRVIYFLEKGADVNQPLCYMDDGTPLNLVKVLRGTIHEIGSREHKGKMLLVKYLEGKGIDYKSTPIPKFIEDRIRREYPDNWKYVLENY